MTGISIIIGLTLSNLLFAYFSEPHNYVEAFRLSFSQLIAITIYIIATLFDEVCQCKSK